MRLILDTNIFLGACLGSGAANKLVSMCLEGKFSPLMGAALFAEYEDVLGREQLFKKSRLNQVERDELFDIYLSQCAWTQIYYGWRPNLRDEGDNHLIELAVAGNAQYIITYNLKDFKNMELQFPELQITSPEAFLSEVQL